MNQLAHYVMESSIWSVAVPFIIGILLFRYLTVESKIVFLLVVAAVVPQVLTDFMIQDHFLNSLYNIYTPVEFAIIYMLFSGIGYISFFRKIRFMTIIVFVVLSIVIMLVYGLQNRFLNEWVCIANLCYVAWIFIFILQSLLDNTAILDSRLPMFWYVAGLILYSPATALVFSFYYSISKNQFIKSLWIIHGIFNTVMYLFFAIGMYKNFRQKMRQKETGIAFN